jgi:hypothetical protein
MESKERGIQNAIQIQDNKPVQNNLGQNKKQFQQGQTKEEVQSETDETKAEVKSIQKPKSPITEIEEYIDQVGDLLIQAVDKIK